MFELMVPEVNSDLKPIVSSWSLWWTIRNWYRSSLGPRISSNVLFHSACSPHVTPEFGYSL